MDYVEITNKDELLDRHNNSIIQITDALKDIDNHVIDFIPFEGAWSIREHIVHIADCEINGFFRYRKAIAEPGSKVMPYDIEAWKANLNYSNQDLQLTLDFIRVLRQIGYYHLKEIKEKDWNDYFVEHPSLGKIGLVLTLSIYIQHVEKHLEYIKRNVQLFREANEL